MRDLVRAGQITTMTITMPDKPGQLNIISNICAVSGANVLELNIIGLPWICLLV